MISTLAAPRWDQAGVRIQRDGDWDLYWMDLSTGAVNQIMDTPNTTPTRAGRGRLWLAYEAMFPAGEGETWKSSSGRWTGRRHRSA